jgi:hypothetical protein
MVKSNKYNEEDKNKLNSFNNKLLKSDDEILQNDGLNEQKQILDKDSFNNLFSLQNSQNENTAIKVFKLIADNLKINNKVDIKMKILKKLLMVEN